jgi:hypothetical protein
VRHPVERGIEQLLVVGRVLARGLLGADALGDVIVDATISPEGNLKTRFSYQLV